MCSPGPIHLPTAWRQLVPVPVYRAAQTAPSSRIHTNKLGSWMSAYMHIFVWAIKAGREDGREYDQKTDCLYTESLPKSPLKHFSGPLTIPGGSCTLFLHLSRLRGSLCMISLRHRVHTGNKAAWQIWLRQGQEVFQKTSSCPYFLSRRHLRTWIDGLFL